MLLMILKKRQVCTCAILKFQSCLKHYSPCVKIASCPTGSSPLDFLNRAGFIFMVGRDANGCSIFQLRLDQFKTLERHLADDVEPNKMWRVEKANSQDS